MGIEGSILNCGSCFRTHDRTILERPDVSNKGKKLAVFVDGCFWHGCPMCYREPKTSRDFLRGWPAIPHGAPKPVERAQANRSDLEHWKH